MRTILRKSSHIPIIVLAICSLFILFGVVFVSRVQAAAPGQGERLIVIHEDGKDRGIITRATTLRQAFTESDIRIDEHDKVEPGLDEELVASHYEVNVYRARPIIIADGAMRHKIMTPHQTPEQIAKDAGFTLQKEDIATISANTDMVSGGAGLQMTIDRAISFTFVFYGTKTTAYTQAKTVGDMLKSKDITLGKDDTLSVPIDTPITKNMTVELWRNGKQTAVVDEDIAFPAEQIKDADRPVGYRQVKTPGEPGKKKVTYEIEMKNGVEVSRKEIQSVVTKEPVKQVEIVGAKPSFSGDFAAALAKLRACESGGNYANKNNPKYRGAYQFSYSTWGNRYGIYDPADASPAQQDQAVRDDYLRSGWRPWPHCGAGLPDIYR